MNDAIALTPAGLTGYLHRHIPLAAAMGARVEAVTATGVRLTAPLSANLNPHGTAFAGSQSVLGILAGWTLLFARLHPAQPEAMLVIRESRFSFRRPLRGDLWAEATATGETLDDFLQAVRTGGRARLTLTAEVGDGDGPCGRHEGVFVALTEPGGREG